MDKGDARRLILGLAQQQRHQRIRSDVYFVLCGILFNVLYLISVRTLLNRATQVRCYYCTHSTDEKVHHKRYKQLAKSYSEKVLKAAFEPALLALKFAFRIKVTTETNISVSSKGESFV